MTCLLYYMIYLIYEDNILHPIMPPFRLIS